MCIKGKTCFKNVNFNILVSDCMNIDMCITQLPLSVSVYQMKIVQLPMPLSPLCVLLEGDPAKVDCSLRKE